SRSTTGRRSRRARNASRMSRLSRLRWTAEPYLRETASPRRACPVAPGATTARRNRSRMPRPFALTCAKSRRVRRRAVGGKPAAGLLPVDGRREAVAPLAPARGEDLAAARGRHAGTEPMLAQPLPVRRLERTLHRSPLRAAPIIRTTPLGEQPRRAECRGLSATRHHLERKKDTLPPPRRRRNMTDGR